MESLVHGHSLLFQGQLSQLKFPIAGLHPRPLNILIIGLEGLLWVLGAPGCAMARLHCGGSHMLAGCATPGWERAAGCLRLWIGALTSLLEVLMFRIIPENAFVLEMYLAFRS